MQKDLGIAALAIAVIALFTPFGAWLTLWVALIAAFAYGEGLWFGIGSIAVNLVHILFFSTRLWKGQGLGEFGVAGDLPFLPWILIAAQVVAIVTLSVLHRKAKAKAAST